MLLNFSEYDKMIIASIYTKLVLVDCLDENDNELDHEVTHYLAGWLRKHHEQVIEYHDRLFWLSKRKTMGPVKKDVFFKPTLYGVATKIYLRKRGLTYD